VYPALYMRTRFATSWEVLYCWVQIRYAILMLLLIMRSLARTDTLN
jgi:hypothetical protein